MCNILELQDPGLDQTPVRLVAEQGAFVQQLWRLRPLAIGHHIFHRRMPDFGHPRLILKLIEWSHWTVVGHLDLLQLLQPKNNFKLLE